MKKRLRHPKQISLNHISVQGQRVRADEEAIETADFSLIVGGFDIVVKESALMKKRLRR